MIDQQCLNCQSIFSARSSDINRGRARFCSISCSSKYHYAQRAKPNPNVRCAYCQKLFYMNNSNKKNSKSGLFFCSRKHKDSAQKIGGIEAIMPPHYGTSTGINDYRERALAYYPNNCSVCGWNEYPEVLEVNHIDCDRSHNQLSNLEILCPNHHRIFHYLLRISLKNCKADVLPLPLMPLGDQNGERISLRQGLHLFCHPKANPWSDEGDLDP